MWIRSALIVIFAASLAAQAPQYGAGKPATAAEINSLGVAIAPDGGGLPEGSGTATAGREVFAARCAK